MKHQKYNSNYCNHKQEYLQDSNERQGTILCILYITIYFYILQTLTFVHK